MMSDFKNEMALQSGKVIKCIKAGGSYFYKDKGVCIKRFGKKHIVVGTTKGEHLIPLRKLDYVEFEDKVEEQ